jgi:4-amino-4-deoxy-L-arabinose transferase-like glycosyltransferase
MLWLVPRAIMGILAVVDTFLIFKISEVGYNRIVGFIASILFAVMPITWLTRWVHLDSIQLPFLLSSILFALYYAKDSQSRYQKSIILILLSGIFWA